jgi:hypothetical protein
MDSVTAAVGEAAGALRRRREGRRPYAKVYDGEGYAALVASDNPLAQELISAAEAMIDVTDAASRRAGRQ